MCAQDMKDTTGLHDASLGARSNETSGIAIQRRQNEGDIATIGYHDNMNAAMQEAGEDLARGEYAKGLGKTVEALAALEAKGLHAIVGSSWTTDAPFRETAEAIEAAANTRDSAVTTIGTDAPKPADAAKPAAPAAPAASPAAAARAAASAPPHGSRARSVPAKMRSTRS